MDPIRDKPALERIARARSALILSQPFFACVALNQELVEAPQVETMAVDGKHLFYNPDFVESLTEAELIGALMHEVLHLTNLHHTRRQGRDHETWNKSCDLAINPMVREAGGVLPKGALFSPGYAGLGAEQIYAELKRGQQGGNQGQQGQDQSQGQDDSQGQNGGGKGQDQGHGQQQGGNDPGQQGHGQPPSGQGQPGSGQGSGPAQPGPGQASDPGGCGGVIDAAPDSAGISQAEAQTQQLVRQAIDAATKGAGELPGHLKRIVETLNQPRVSWREELARLIDDAATVAVSWSRPDKRFLRSGFFLPGHVKDSIGKLVAFVDTSGSINDPALQAFGGEMQGILDSGRVEELVIVYGDTEVRGEAAYERGGEVKLKAPGGGGTRFAQIMKHIALHHHDAVALIGFSDLECGEWGNPPLDEVIWCAWGRKTEAPYGQVVRLDPYDRR